LILSVFELSFEPLNSNVGRTANTVVAIPLIKIHEKM
jgi:hypothetical protein